MSSSPGAIHLIAGDVIQIDSPIAQTIQMVSVLELDAMLRNPALRAEVLACHGILFAPQPLLIRTGKPTPRRKPRHGPSFRQRQAAGRAARRETVSVSAN